MADSRSTILPEESTVMIRNFKGTWNKAVPNVLSRNQQIAQEHSVKFSPKIKDEYLKTFNAFL